MPNRHCTYSHKKLAIFIGHYYHDIVGDIVRRYFDVIFVGRHYGLKPALDAPVKH